MRGPLTVILERGVVQAPGLLFVAVGMSLLAAAVLIPAWQDNRKLTQRHDVLEHQAELMAAQRERYVEFHDALAANDPQLLQRLAFSQLHVRPVEGDVWPGDEPAWVGKGDDRLAMTASIDAALAEPMAHVRPKPSLVAPPSRMERLATGTSRVGLLGAALCFVAGGLWYGGDKRDIEPIAVQY